MDATCGLVEVGQWHTAVVDFAIRKLARFAVLSLSLKAPTLSLEQFCAHAGLLSKLHHAAAVLWHLQGFELLMGCDVVAKGHWALKLYFSRYAHGGVPSISSRGCLCLWCTAADVL